MSLRDNMDIVEFNGRNCPEGLSDNLKSVVYFLLDKEVSGDFVYSTSVAGWEEQCSVIDPLNLSYFEKSNYFSVGISYLASINRGSYSSNEM